MFLFRNDYNLNNIENNSDDLSEPKRLSTSSSHHHSEKLNDDEFFSLNSGSELTKGPSSESIKIYHTPIHQEQIEETTIDDLKLLNCSRFLQIREIIVASEDFIN